MQPADVRMTPLQIATPVSALLSPALVLPDLAARTKSDVIEALAAHVGATQPHVDGRQLADALHAREDVSSTALEHGVAIPHVRVPALPAPLAVLARCPAGVAFGAADETPTRLFLLLVVAAEQPGGHLRLLASAARLLSDAGCRARLLEAGTAHELLDVLHAHEQRSGRRAA